MAPGPGILLSATFSCSFTLARAPRCIFSSFFSLAKNSIVNAELWEKLSEPACCHRNCISSLSPPSPPSHPSRLLPSPVWVITGELGRDVMSQEIPASPLAGFDV